MQQFNGFNVKVETFDHGVIVSEIEELRGGVRLSLVRKALATQDELVRKALIDLGWTPPPK